MHAFHIFGDHMESQLKEQSEQFQEAVRQLSEGHKVYTVTIYCTMIIIVVMGGIAKRF